MAGDTYGKIAPRFHVTVAALTAVLIVLPALVLRASLARGTPSALDQALLRITAPLETGVSWIVDGLPSGHPAARQQRERNRLARQLRARWSNRLAQLGRKRTRSR